MEEVLDKFLGQPVHLLGPIDPPPQDLLVDPWRSLVKERWESDHHFISEDTTCPPVSRFPVTFIKDDLGGEVLGGSTQGPGTILDNLGKPKIGESQISTRV